MTEGGTNATNDVLGSRWMPSPAVDALVAILRDLHPWTDVPTVQSAIAAWTRSLQPAPPLDGADAYNVAEHLARIDGGDVPARNVAALVLDMLANMASGRDPDDFGDGFEHIEVIDNAARFDPRGSPVVPGRPLPARTRRDYRQRFGLEAVAKWMKAFQRRVDVSELVRRGRSRQAALAWVRRHRRLHARDAGPPRRPRA